MKRFLIVFVILTVSLIPGFSLETGASQDIPPEKTEKKDEKTAGNTDKATTVIIDEEKLQSLPTARNPWTIINLVPGMLLDREDVGGNAEHPELCGRCVENVAGEGESRRFA